MSELLEKVPEYLTAIVVIASILVRITPSEQDNRALGSFGRYVGMLLHFLPTIGINPKTKRLQKALEDLERESRSTGSGSRDT